MKRLLLIFVLSSFFLANAFAQKLSFQDFSVDKGLIQSQVLAITQDEQRHLWLGTFGGLDRFDGTSFKHFTKAEGLNSSSITCLYVAKNGYIWAGTFKGISCYDGFKIINYPVQHIAGVVNFYSITESATGELWAYDPQNGLFVFQNKQFNKAALPFAGAIPTCMFKNTNGELLVNFYKHGVFFYENNTWKKFEEIPFADTVETIISINNYNQDYYVFTNRKRILKFSGKLLVAEKQLDTGFTCPGCFDDTGNFWIGTVKGVLMLHANDLSDKAVFTAVSGVSDNLVTNIYKDVEGNIWITTDGDGFFKYSGGSFVKFDNTNGLPGNVVMGIVPDTAGNLFIGTREKGLVKINSLDKKIIPVDYSSVSKFGINCMGADAHQHLFLGTMDSKFIRLNGRSFKQIMLEKKSAPFVNTITADNDKTWLATSTGCYYLQGDSINKINGIEEIALGILPLGKNETLIGSINGIYSVSNNEAKKISIPSLENIETNCFSQYHGFILVGTAEDGVYFWNRQSGKVYKCNTKNGLSDNQVFGILVDSKDNIWVGAGSGIQQLVFNENNFSFKVKQFSRADGYENAEINLNAITEDKEGHIWIGTTKGVFVFNKEVSKKTDINPYTVIQNIISPGLIKDSGYNGRSTGWYNFPLSPVLPYSQNNISFSVKGIYLKDPESAMYSYQLAGYDTGFSIPVKQTFFNYQNLEPGNYTFRVRALIPGQKTAGNIAAYSFSVSRPFYKTKWFLFLVMLALILLGILVQFLFSKARQRKQQQRALNRLEDQQKIRQRTSEDFHDELGNKLTRISLLADILQKKLGQSDAEKNNLIQQIRENVSELYTGTKDIIWSLSPVSDHLSEILKRMQHFGEELFHDSGIEFELNGLDQIDTAILLPMDWSRNIIMIFKEALNNSLRHSACSKVAMSVVYNNIHEVSISVTDNGKGFEQNNIAKGNGLNNIKRRTERIGAAITMNTIPNQGTTIILTIKIPSEGG